MTVQIYGRDVELPREELSVMILGAQIHPTPRRYGKFAMVGPHGECEITSMSTVFMRMMLRKWPCVVTFQEMEIEVWGKRICARDPESVRARVKNLVKVTNDAIKKSGLRLACIKCYGYTLVQLDPKFHLVSTE